MSRTLQGCNHCSKCSAPRALFPSFSSPNFTVNLTRLNSAGDTRSACIVCARSRHGRRTLNGTWSTLLQQYHSFASRGQFPFNFARALLNKPRFCNRSLRYTDAYSKGLNGREAAYATKIYRGHRAIPNDYLKDFEQSGAIEAFKALNKL
ncbi:hypothetical protein C8R46DRAFT_900574 [Mycena filopes]|nr:hypothetical protein C8R46DRAFT_900574 [Mycena filopes]